MIQTITKLPYADIKRIRLWGYFSAHERLAMTRDQFHDTPSKFYYSMRGIWIYKFQTLVDGRQINDFDWLRGSFPVDWPWNMVLSWLPRKFPWKTKLTYCLFAVEIGGEAPLPKKCIWLMGTSVGRRVPVPRLKERFLKMMFVGPVIYLSWKVNTNKGYKLVLPDYLSIRRLSY